MKQQAPLIFVGTVVVAALAFLLWKFVATDSAVAVFTVFALVVVVLQHQQIQRLTTQNEKLQDANLSLSRDSSGVALAGINASARATETTAPPAQHTFRPAS